MPMRRFFIFLMAVMFVGSHGLSDWVHPSHENSGTGVASITLTSTGKTSVRVITQAMVDKVVENCCSKGDTATSFDAFHCSAYCGLMTAQLIGVYPDTNSDLYVKLFLSYTPVPTSDHFRPPIV